MRKSVRVSPWRAAASCALRCKAARSAAAAPERAAAMPLRYLMIRRSVLAASPDSAVPCTAALENGEPPALAVCGTSTVKVAAAKAIAHTANREGFFDFIKLPG